MLVSTGFASDIRASKSWYSPLLAAILLYNRRVPLPLSLPTMPGSLQLAYYDESALAVERVNKLADLLLADADLFCALLLLPLHFEGGDNPLDRRAACSRARLESSVVMIETPLEGLPKFGMLEVDLGCHN